MFFSQKEPKTLEVPQKKNTQLQSSWPDRFAELSVYFSHNCGQENSRGPAVCLERDDVRKKRHSRIPRRSDSMPCVRKTVPDEKER
jgi:hypothetical protein